jgi:excisionase family DNA binding protein
MHIEKEHNFTNEELKLLANEIVSCFKEVNKADDELECLSVAKVAELLGHSVSEVRKLIREKKLKAFHSGTSLKIRKIKLLEYIENLENEEEN